MSNHCKKTLLANILLLTAGWTVAIATAIAAPVVTFQSPGQNADSTDTDPSGMVYVPATRPAMSAGQFDSGVSQFNQKSMQQMNQQSQQLMQQQLSQLPPPAPPTLQKSATAEEPADGSNTSARKKPASGVTTPSAAAVTGPSTGSGFPATPPSSSVAPPDGEGNPASTTRQDYTGFQADSSAGTADGNTNTPSTGGGLGIKY